jgi:hypothetical protein
MLVDFTPPGQKERWSAAPTRSEGFGNVVKLFIIGSQENLDKSIAFG